jgi:hypothetical protein
LGTFTGIRISRRLYAIQGSNALRIEWPQWGVDSIRGRNTLTQVRLA